mmetsp:Transcript_41096/g.87562  ORF Transcript_41096/g.87562 Transcript_41096/m.87562 type:complete len:107 (+) Transcript_41096:1668-1988(+)
MKAGVCTWDDDNSVCEVGTYPWGELKSEISNCDGKKIKKCRKNDECEWNGEFCIDKSLDFPSVREKVSGFGGSIKFRPIRANSSPVVTKISSMFGTFVIVMWYQWN